MTSADLSSLFDSTTTAADLAERFGPIPLHRLRPHAFPTRATDDDVVEIELHEHRLYELYGGVLVEKAMGFYESMLAVTLLRSLGDFVMSRNHGIVTGEAGMLMLTPGEVRIPDVSFISWERLPGRRVPREPIPQLVPDLVVEIISQGTTAREMQVKRDEYVAAGVRLIWYVYAEEREVHVFTSGSHSVLQETDSLSGGDVLPGYSIPLVQLFAEPTETSRPE